MLLGVGAALSPAIGIAAVAAVGAGVAILNRPILGAYALVALAPTLSGLQRGLPVPGFRLSEILIVGIAAVVLISARETPRWGVFDWAAFAYVIANGALVWANVARTGGSFSLETLGTLLGPVQFFLLYRTLLTVVREMDQRARALRILLLASVPVALLTMLQQLNIGGAREFAKVLAGSDAAVAYGGTLNELARATGPFPHWHNLAGYLLLVLLVAVSLLHEPGQRVLPRPLLVAILVPAVVALFQTASIAPIAGLLVGAVLIAGNVGEARRALAWLGVAIVLVTVAFWPVIEERVALQFGGGATTEGQTFLPQTISFRYEVWTTQFFPVIRDNLILGYGPDLPPRLFFGYAESLYVTFLLRGGIILLLSYLAVMATLAIRSRRIARSDEPERKAIGRVVFAAVFLLLVIDTIATYFIDSGPAPLLWTLAGLMGYTWSRAHGLSTDDEPTRPAPQGHGRPNGERHGDRSRALREHPVRGRRSPDASNQFV